MISTPAFSSPAFWCREFHSRFFHSCFFWRSRVFHSRVFSRPVRNIAMSMSVCPSVCMSLCPLAYTSKTACLNSTKFSVHGTVAIAWLSSDHIAICCVFPVLWMTSCFHITGSIGQNQSDVMLVPVRQVAATVGSNAAHTEGEVCYPRLSCCIGAKLPLLVSYWWCVCVHWVAGLHRALISRFDGRGFDSWPPRCRVTILGSVRTSRVHDALTGACPH